MRCFHHCPSPNFADTERATGFGNGDQMKIWSCVSGIQAQTWYYTDDQRIALQNQGQSLCSFPLDGQMTYERRVKANAWT